MIIRCIGHAEFLIELENGMRIVTDPYDASCGYPVEQLQAHAALVSHGHHDHNAVENLTGLETVIDKAGVYDLDEEVRVTAVEADHDDAGGSKRGKTLLFCLEAEGLRVMHLGDLGHIPDEAQLAALGRADVLMLPVGGFYTIDAEQALQTAEKLHARVVLPMHYRTAYNADWPIAPVEAFTEKCGGNVEFLNLLRVAKGDLACQPATAVLSSTAAARA